MAYSLFHTASLVPVANESRKVLFVHERNVVNMSIYLSHQHNRRWYAFLTGALRIRSVVILAIIVDFVSCWGHKCAVRTLWVLRVRLYTLLFAFCQVRVKRYVLDVCYFLLFRFLLTRYGLLCCSWSILRLSWRLLWWLAHSVYLHRPIRWRFSYFLLTLTLNRCHDNVTISHKNGVSVFDSYLC